MGAVGGDSSTGSGTPTGTAHGRFPVVSTERERASGRPQVALSWRASSWTTASKVGVLNDCSKSTVEYCSPVSTVSPSSQSSGKRISHEAAFLQIASEAVADLPVSISTGMGAANRFGINGWNLSPLQTFQFGDLRAERPDATVIVEVESGGGVGNLVKYWPILRDGSLRKRLVLMHLYMLGSTGDYIAHRRLWEFLVDRMDVDLQSAGVSRPEHWDAELLTYRKGEPPDVFVRRLRATIQNGGALRGG
jgi:hypothetical protein